MGDSFERKVSYPDRKIGLEPSMRLYAILGYVVTEFVEVHQRAEVRMISHRHGTRPLQKSSTCQVAESLIGSVYCQDDHALY